MAIVNPPGRLPGVYHDIESVVQIITHIPDRGRAIAMIPLNWFEDGKIVEVHAREWMSNESLSKIGMNSSPEFYTKEVGIENNLGINALMDGAVTGLIFPQNTGGNKASADIGDITITARKNGIAGNEITVNFSEQNDLIIVTTLFRGNSVSVQRMDNLAALQNNNFVEFDFDPDTAVLTTGEVILINGNNGTIANYTDKMGDFLDAALLEEWDTIAFSVDPEDSQYLQAINAFDSWLNQLNEDSQESRHGICFNTSDLSSDSYYITNIRQTAEFDGIRLSPSEMVLYEAGQNAGAAGNHSRTADRQSRLSNLEERYNIREKTNFMNRGFLLYDQDQHGVISVVRDINSFVSTTLRFNIQWTDNRTMRTLHTWKRATNILFNRDFKGSVDDTSEGRTTFKIALSSLAETFQENNMIAEHDISKITVISNGFRTWQATYKLAVIPTAVDTLDLITRIQW